MAQPISNHQVLDGLMNHIKWCTSPQVNCLFWTTYLFWNWFWLNARFWTFVIHPKQLPRLFIYLFIFWVHFYVSEREKRLISCLFEMTSISSLFIRDVTRPRWPKRKTMWAARLVEDDHSNHSVFFPAVNPPTSHFDNYYQGDNTVRPTTLRGTLLCSSGKILPFRLNYSGNI